MSAGGSAAAVCWRTAVSWASLGGLKKSMLRTPSHQTAMGAAMIRKSERSKGTRTDGY